MSQLSAGPVTTVGSKEICNQQEFTVPVTVNNFTDVGAINLTLSYNPTYLQVVDVNNNLIPGTWFYDINYAVPGKITIAGIGDETTNNALRLDVRSRVARLSSATSSPV